MTGRLRKVAFAAVATFLVHSLALYVALLGSFANIARHGPPRPNPSAENARIVWMVLGFPFVELAGWSGWGGRLDVRLLIGSTFASVAWTTMVAWFVARRLRGRTARRVVPPR